MEKIELEVFSQASNFAVIRVPGRRFPGSVIQGDSLSILYHQAAFVARRARTTSDTELIEAADYLCELITERLRHYEEVLQAAGIDFPYAPIDWEQKPSH